MQLSPTIIAAHCPKTGGTWLGYVLQSEAGATSYRGGHDPAWSIPAEDRAGRQVVGTVRDPWSWYGSLYVHACHGDQLRRSILAEYAGIWESVASEVDYRICLVEFKAALWGMTHGVRVSRRPGVLFDAFPGNALPYDGRHGLFSWCMAVVYGDNSGSYNLAGLDTVVDMGRASDAAAALLGLEAKRIAEEYPPRNTRYDKRRQFNGPSDWADWYDDEMIGWVARADAWLIRAFGFEPLGPSRAPLHRASMVEAA